MIGGNSAQKAANEQRAAQIAAANQVNATTASNQGFVSNAGTDAQENATAAAGTANTGIAGAVQQGNQTIGANQQQIAAGYSPFTAAVPGAINGLQQIATGSTSPLTQTFTAPTLSDVNNGPGDAGYQFTLQQGQQAIQRAAAAQGNLFSTGTLKSLAGYTTGSANQYYNTAFQQAQQAFQTNQQSALAQAGILQNLSGQGLTATQGNAGALQTSGLAQSGNTIQGAYQQGGNTINAAQYAGNTGLGTAQFNATLGNNAAVEAGNFATGGANAQAQGTLAQGRSNQGIVSSVTSGLTGYLNSIGLGGVQSGASGGNTNIPTLNLPTPPTFPATDTLPPTVNYAPPV